MDTKSFHLEHQHAPEGLLKGVVPKGEFHEIARPASQALLTGVTPTREIHLKNQCASEGILEGVGPKGEFHITVLMSAGTALMRTETAREVARPPGLSDGFMNRVVFAAVFSRIAHLITKKRRTHKNSPLFGFAQHERALTGASPQTALIVGRLQPKTRVSAVRRNLKEVGGKRLARCTRTWYKAERQGQCCTRSKSPITIRTADSKPSGYKPERVRP